MKILFLCGSLEPGKDGVGDYTRRLAGELIQRGFEISIIALNDKHIDAICQTNQRSGEIDIDAIRLPSTLSSKERYSYTKNFIIKYKPEWICLQYVPYSYDKYGIPRSLATFSKGLKKQGVDFSVMVHEPFIRIDDSLNPKYVVVAFMQRFFLRKILSSASIAMTSITHYTKLLHTYNKKIIINRIPPNIIPVSIHPEILKNNKEILLRKMNASKLIVIFGDRNADCVIDAVKEINQNNQNRIGVLIVGKTSKDNINKEFVHQTGILPEVDVSVHLQIADLFILPERVYKNNRGGASFKSGALAAAFATPLPVMSSSGDMTDSPPMIHGGNIWFTDFNDPKRLKNEINLLLHDATLLEKIKHGAYQLYKEYLNWDVIIRKYSDIISSKNR